MQRDSAGTVSDSWVCKSLMGTLHRLCVPKSLWITGKGVSSR